MYKYEFEQEALPEFEVQHEFESERESEEFFRRLAGLSARAARSPALRRVGLRAARSALRSLDPVRAAIPGIMPGAETNGRPEAEWEYEWELAGEINPIRCVYPDALMEHLGHAAAKAESEAEAESYVGALIPLAAQIIPLVTPTVMRAAPQLIRGATRVARTLRRSPTTRPLVRAMPTVVRRAVTDMARQASRGQQVTPRTAVSTLARQTRQVLSSPRQCVQAYRRSRALDRRFHQAARAGAGVR
jgi:hypothetical protein